MGPEVLASIAAAASESAIPLLLSGGGALLQSQAASDQAAQRRSVLNRQLERDNRATDKSIQLVQDAAGGYSPQQRLENLAKQEEQVYGQTQKDLQGGANIDTASDAGNVSADFLKTKAARAIDEGTRLTTIARQAAKARAPGSLQSDDALSRAGLAGSLQNLWGTNSNLARANGMEADSVEQPGYGALGSVASSIGTGMLAGKLGKAKPGVQWDQSMYQYARDL